jgi:hypothetical protein
MRTLSRVRGAPNPVVTGKQRVVGRLRVLECGIQYGPVLQGRDFTGLTFGIPAAPPADPDA